MKVIDITEKLNFEEKPKIKIRDVEITVNNSAVVMLKIMPKLNKNEISPNDVVDVIKKLVSSEDMAKLEALELSFQDFTTFIESAIKLIITGASEEGEAQTRTTT